MFFLFAWIHLYIEANISMIYQSPNTTIIGFPCVVFQIVTNGIYRSIEHRATVNSAKERLSMATFYSPRLEANIGPAPTLITPESPALFKTISVIDFFRGSLLHKLDGKAYIDGMRIQNEEQKGN